jgi:myo-inositol 2-dehydrogenase/D-chiro-inositol 1-dehydrogenase
MEATIGVGVLGAGTMGSAHVATIAGGVPAAHVAAVADADPARARAAAALAPAARVHADPYALIADPVVEAVIVASSDETHEAFVIACLEAGKPVLCEKPLAVTAAAGLRVVEAEAAAGRRLAHVGFQRRYDPAYTAVKERVDAGGVGQPLLVHCTHRNGSAPGFFTSEMLVTSSLVHEIDVTRWLLDTEIATVTVLAPRSSGLAAAGLRDPQLALLETVDGVLVDVEVFVNSGRGYEIRCEVVGETGTVALADHGGAVVADDFRSRFAVAYRLELQAWVEAVGGGRASGAGAWDGYAANVVADACLESLATGTRADVRLTPRPALYA